MNTILFNRFWFNRNFSPKNTYGIATYTTYFLLNILALIVLFVLKAPEFLFIATFLAFLACTSFLTMAIVTWKMEKNSKQEQNKAEIKPQAVKSQLVDNSKTVKVDDLKKIEGIGTKIEGLLNDNGIMTFEQLSLMKVENLKAILDNAGSRYAIHDPSSWPQQATLAYNNKFDELAQMQASLKHGKIS
jgi:predicted flap endonuclease-1-like 5' DNA nuclease